MIGAKNDSILLDPFSAIQCFYKKTKKPKSNDLGYNVVPPGIEPGTHGFSVRCSTN